jgi:NAD(P)-dependent dehydrogenase (short-subunit alcohol dehydrogenase family)
MNAYDLSGKVALITGGAGGLGYATAQALLTRGARVAIVDTSKRASDLSPTSAFGAVADVTDVDAMEAVVEATRERFGRIDIAVANAGVMGAASTLRTMPTQSAQQVFAVNVDGVLNTVRSSMPEVVANRGQIVLVSSVFAFLNGMGAIPYAMSKAAVEQLGRGLRMELAEHGVSVLTAYFALIQTDMVRNGIDADPRVLAMMNAFPRPLHKRLEPAAAAEAIVRGLERQSPRVVRPRRWVPLSIARGVLGPAMDARVLRDENTLKILSQLDVPQSSVANSQGCRS